MRRPAPLSSRPQLHLTAEGYDAVGAAVAARLAALVER
jgi:lysophospholipase L1-like esterase